MKKPGIDGGFWLCLALNMVLNLQWLIPAVILLACHFVLGISLWWFVAAVAIWFLWIFVTCIVLAYVAGSAKPTDANVAPDPEKREEIMRKSAELINR